MSNLHKKNRPIVGLAMGDAAGIGPELIVKALAEPNAIDGLDSVVIGDAKIIQKVVSILNYDLQVRIIDDPSDAVFSPRTVNVIDLNNVPLDLYASGRAHPITGKGAVESIQKAVELALERKIDAIASAPVSKEAIHLAGCNFAGVTEYLAHLTECSNFEMVLVLGPIRLFYLTNHTSMKKALAGVTKESVIKKILAVDDSLKDLGISSGKIAVAALNPHGGEAGAMGTEETTEIIPAIEAAKEKGVNVVGPFPADTIFVHGKKGEFDAILAMYHDQGNIAAKLLDFGAGVTFVAGLPIIRTSVAHGTAFDIAGKGIASPQTYIAAIKQAGKIAIKRNFVH